MIRRIVHSIPCLKVLALLTAGLLLCSGISLPGQPFSSLSKLAQAAAADSSTDLPAPSWWKGDCDTQNYEAATRDPKTGVGRKATPLGGSYRGVQACGPRPQADNAPNVPIYFFKNAHGELEWQCVELVMRYMYLAYTIEPFKADGQDVVTNYTGMKLNRINNGTRDQAPKPGDVISFGGTSISGHTSIVVGSNIDSNGDGTIKTLNQNRSDANDGYLIHKVSKWQVAALSGAGAAIGWLHDPLADNQPKPTGTIEGFVKLLGTNAPVVQASVTFTGSGANIPPAITDGNGHYQFSNVPLGSAKIAADKPGIGNNAIDIVVNAATTAPDILLTSPRSLSIALIIDSSGSMSWNDPTDIRKAAAKLFVQTLDASDQLAVIDFDDVARTIWPLMSVGDHKAQIEQSIDAYIDSDGGTDISGGLREGYGDLNNGIAGQKVAILLTDGQQAIGTYDPQWQTAFKNSGWPVYTFGLSNEADAQLLQGIAAATGGSYQALTDAKQLQSFYNSLRSTIKGAYPLLDRNVVMQTGDTSTSSVVVPPYTRVATFVTSWPGSSVDSILQAPDGTLITPASVDLQISHVKESTFEIYQVQFPQSGVWQISAYGSDLAAGGEAVTLQADALLSLQQVFVPIHVRGQQSASIPPTSTLIPPTSTPPTATPTSTSTSTATSTPTSTPTSTSTPTVTTTPTSTSTSTPTSTPTSTSTPTNGTLLRIEVGGSADYIDSAGNTWLADRGFIGGTTVERGNIAIAGTSDPRIYQTERYSMAGYALPVANGAYTVRLHFAETHSGITGPGQRVFGVNVEGTSINGIDIFGITGGRNIALVKSVDVAVSDGQLNIDFTSSVENPEINGIEVLPVNTGATALTGATPL